MSENNLHKVISKARTVVSTAAVTIVFAFTPQLRGAVPGITGPTFNLVASPAYLTQPDGAAVYSWGYGCNGTPSGFAPSAITNGFCNTMQIPGPTLIVNQGDLV